MIYKWHGTILRSWRPTLASCRLLLIDWLLRTGVWGSVISLSVIRSVWDLLLFIAVSRALRVSPVGVSWWHYSKYSGRATLVFILYVSLFRNWCITLSLTYFWHLFIYILKNIKIDIYIVHLCCSDLEEGSIVCIQQVVQMMGIDLLRQPQRWKDGLMEIRQIMANLVSQGFPVDNMKPWKGHWDRQLYKALEHQYQIGLEALNENLPEIKVELTYRYTLINKYTRIIICIYNDVQVIRLCKNWNIYNFTL